MSSKKISSKKVINLVAGVLLVAGFIVLVACNLGHSRVFKLEKGEAEALGVVFPEEGSPYESYFQLFEKYENNREYEKAVVVAKKMIEISPKTEGGYLDLLTCYERLKRYEEALIVNQKLIKMTPPNPNDESVTCGYVVNHAAILEHSGKQTEAIKFLEKYRKECPKITEGFIPALKEAQSKGQLFFPVPE